jgi:CubicO group peptidase (beta-lactamase class C family)
LWIAKENRWKTFRRIWQDALAKKTRGSTGDAKHTQEESLAEQGVALLLLVAGFLLANAGAIQGQTPAASVAKLAPYPEAKENADRQAKDWIAWSSARASMNCPKMRRGVAFSQLPKTSFASAPRFCSPVSWTRSPWKLTSQKTGAGEETGYGIGWGIVKTPSGKQTYAHAGGLVGGTSQLVVYPDSHVVVALATNLSGGTWKTEEVKAVAEAFEAIKK